jgi:hypothetical protein
LEGGKTQKRGFDSLLTVLSNGTLAFVFNKGVWGVGYLAEGHKQRAAKEIAKIAGIGKRAKIEIKR